MSGERWPDYARAYARRGFGFHVADDSRKRFTRLRIGLLPRFRRMTSELHAMILTGDGPYAKWSDPDGRGRVAADADGIAAFLDARPDPQDWRCVGSPDEGDEVFVAAHRSAPDGILAVLAIGGKWPLPDGAARQVIDRDGLDLFTDDSGGNVLTLPSQPVCGGNAGTAYCLIR